MFDNLCVLLMSGIEPPIFTRPHPSSFPCSAATLSRLKFEAQNPFLLPSDPGLSRLMRLGAPGLMSMSSTDFAPRNPVIALSPARTNECCRLVPADREDPRLLSVGRLLSSAEDCRPKEDESSKTWSYCTYETRTV